MTGHTPGDSLIEQPVLERVLQAALRTGGEFAEVFAEDKRNGNAALDDGRVEQLSSGRDRGAGIRVVVGETTGFAHTADLSEAGLLSAAEAASAAARRGGGGVNRVALTRTEAPAPNEVRIYPEDVAKGDQVAILRQADEAARAAGREITQVTAGIGGSRRRMLVANSDGLLTGDDQVRTFFMVNAVATGDTGMQTGRKTIGHTVGWELFDRIDVDEFAAEAAQQALTKLRARPAPSGQLPVVIGAGSGGVLFHEACGHGLEKDLVDKGASVYAGKVGELVASPLVTLVDDGTIAEEWGAFAVDDEGTPAQRNVLIEDGVLTDYMWDFLRNRKEGRPNSGNGRRQSYQHLPMVRMTNTFLAGGDTDPDDIIAGTEHGVYVAKLGGGQVNTASGEDLILKHMQPGNIHTHFYGRLTPQLDENKRVRDYMWKARERGVLFDVGHGSGSFWFRIAVPAIRQGFLPDTISTDIHKNSIMLPHATLINVMSKFLNIGMTLEQVIERTTVNAAKAIRRYELGNLDEGGVADIAVLEVERGRFPFLDSGRAKHIGDRRLNAILTIRAGEIAWDLKGLAAEEFSNVGPYSNFQ